MYKWMGKRPFYFPLSILTLIVIYGAPTLLLQLSASTAATWTAAVIYWILFVFVSAVVLLFAIREVFIGKDDLSVRTIIIGTMDGYFALVHVLAGLFVSIFTLGELYGTIYFLVPIGTKGYNLFFTYALANSITLFNTVGSVNITPMTVVGSLWTMTTSVMGIGYLMLFLSMVFWHLRDVPKKTIVHQFPTSSMGNSQRMNRPPRPTGSYIGSYSSSSRLRKK